MITHRALVPDTSEQRQVFPSEVSDATQISPLHEGQEVEVVHLQSSPLEVRQEGEAGARVLVPEHYSLRLALTAQDVVDPLPTKVKDLTQIQLLYYYKYNW